MTSHEARNSAQLISPRRASPRRGRATRLAIGALLCLSAATGQTSAQTTYTWQQIKEKFETANPTLRAAQVSIDESRATEITANLRPNPEVSLSADGVQVNRGAGWRPLSGVVETPGFSYLHERQQKRELRTAGARQSTAIAGSTYADQERNLLFNLRNAFVQVLQSKAVLDNARENLAYWDRTLQVNRNRFSAGDMAQVDLNRLELQRVQFESDFETAAVNVRTAKIELLTLLNDRTPIDQFDVNGTYDYKELSTPLEQFRDVALDARPDLKAAAQNVELARTNHQLAVANGSTDPTFSAWFSHNPSFSNPFATNTIGGSVS